MSLHRHIMQLALGLFLLLPFAAQAEIFKCVAEDKQITFSQTPCPQKVTKPTTKAAPVTDREEPVPVNNEADSAPAPIVAVARLSPEVKRARERAAQADEEQQRRQCEARLHAQINNINAQMSNDSSTRRATALKKKRGTLESQLSDC